MISSRAYFKVISLVFSMINTIFIYILYSYADDGHDLYISLFIWSLYVSVSVITSFSELDLRMGAERGGKKGLP